MAKWDKLIHTCGDVFSLATSVEQNVSTFMILLANEHPRDRFLSCGALEIMDFVNKDTIQLPVYSKMCKLCAVQANTVPSGSSWSLYIG